MQLVQGSSGTPALHCHVLCSFSTLVQCRNLLYLLQKFFTGQYFKAELLPLESRPNKEEELPPANILLL